MAATEMRRLVVAKVEIGPLSYVQARKGSLSRVSGWDLLPGKPLVARLGLAYTCQILARWALAFSRTNFQVLPKILPQKNAQENASFVVKEERK
jgi:hypothetical protein